MRDELRVGGAHQLDDLLDEARQEHALDADPVALLDRAAHDAAQDVAAVLVGRARRRRRSGTSSRASGRRGCAARARRSGARRPASSRPSAHQRRELVGLEDRLGALLDQRHAVEAQARVDVRRRQRRQRARRVLVVLHEDEVPVLQEALVLAAGQVVRRRRTRRRGRGRARCTGRTGRSGRPARSSPSAGTGRSARAGRRPPPRPRSPPRPGPSPSSSSPSKTVIQMSSGLKPNPFSDSSQASSTAPSLKYSPIEKLPSISKNVRCRAVLPTFSMSVVRKHFWQLVRQRRGRRLEAQEVALERVHPGGREQHRRVERGGDERRRRQAPVAALLEEREEGLADLVRGRAHGAIVAQPTTTSPRSRTAVWPGAAPQTGSRERQHAAVERGAAPASRGSAASPRRPRRRAGAGARPCSAHAACGAAPRAGRR